MKFYDDFLGTDDCNITLPFVGGDSKRQFIENSATQPPDWYYHTHDISYEYNSFGHRSKNINQIDLDNYVLFTGCSHTTGIGLKLEHTYPYLISQKMQCSYYNLSVPATGIDVLEHNLLIWISTIKKKPRAVFIQWPDHSRFITYNERYSVGSERGSWSDDPADIALLVNGEDTGLFNARKELARKLIIQTIKTPVYSFNYANLKPYGNKYSSLSQIDDARDLSHSGIKSHASFADKIYAEITN